MKIASLIILVSFFSAYVGIGIGSLLFGPLPLLSFPFYAIQDEMHGSPIPPEGYSWWIPTYRILFLTKEISNLKANDSAGVGTYHLFGYHVLFLNREVGYIDGQNLGNYRLTFPFLFFLLVNSVGAVFGFVMSRWKALKKSEWRLRIFFGLVALGVIIMVAGIFLSSFGVATTIRNPPWTGDYYTVTLYPYREDAFAFVMFGITWLAIIILDALAQDWFEKIIMFLLSLVSARAQNSSERVLRVVLRC